MSHIFISYSRKDTNHAQEIVDALALENLDTWIDWKSIPKGEDWFQEIRRGIEDADAFLFLMSPNSVTSEMCNIEITHAVKNNKRILPIVIHDTDINTFLYELSKNEISKRNWILCRKEQDDFNKAIDDTQKAIHTDYEWLRYHTKLQVKALEWERRKDSKDNSRLLRGKELREAEEELTRDSTQDPVPTELQRRYVLESRRRENRNRTSTLTIAAGIIVVLVFLVMFAFNQRAVAVIREEEAKKQAQLALARQLSNQAQSIMSSNNSRQLTAVLLAVQSVQILPTSGALEILEDNILAHPVSLMNHDSVVTNVKFSPDGTKVASSSEDGIIRLWETESGKEIFRITQKGEISALVFSADGRYVVSGSSSGIATVWDANTGKEISHMAHEGPIWSIAISPDSKYVVSGGGFDDRPNGRFDTRVQIWDATNGLLYYQMNFGSGINSITFSPNGKFIAAGSFDYGAAIWENILPDQYARGDVLVDFSGDRYTVYTAGQYLAESIKVMNHDSVVSSVAFTPDSQYVASGSWDGTARIWSVITGEEVSRVTGTGVTSVAFSPDGEYVITGQFKKAVVSETATGKEVSHITYNDSADFVNFNPYYTWYVLSGSNSDTDGTAHLWDSKIGRKIAEFTHDGGITSIDFSPITNNPYQHYIVTGSKDGTARVWTYTRVNGIVADSWPSSASLEFSPENEYLAIGGYDSAYVTNVPNGELISEIAQPGDINSIHFSPDGKYVISASTSGINEVKGSILVWETATGKEIFRKITGSIAFSTAMFSPDGHYIISSYDDGTTNYNITISLQEFPAGKEVSHLDIANKTDGLITDSDFFPLDPDKGKYLVALGTKQSIEIWSFPDGKKLTGIPYSAYVMSVNFSPDGKYLLAGSEDGTARVWMTNTGVEVSRVTQNERIYSTTFSPDGNYVASTGTDNTIYVWDPNTGAEIVRRNLGGAIAFSPDGKYIASGGYPRLGGTFIWLWKPNDLIENACSYLPRNLNRAEWNQYIVDVFPYPTRQKDAPCPNLPIEH